MALEAAFEALNRQAEQLKGTSLRQLFAADPNRFDTFSARTDDLLLDYSKSRIDDKAFNLLLDLARAADVEGKRAAMFAGEKINLTEKRVVLHVALREFGLAGTEMEHAQAGTIRTKLLKIGGRLRVSVRRVWISISESYPYQHLFEQILENLRRQHPQPLQV